MADKKISELPSGTTVYDADDFAIVQDGTTKQFNASAVKTYVNTGVVTLTGTQTLTNKTLTSPLISGGSASSLTSLSVIGNTTLGDASTDTVTINGTAVSIPNNLNFDSNTLFIDAANNRVGIGTSSPTSVLSVFGNANITGNTTLGDASTDTVTVNGYMGIGGAANQNVQLKVLGTSQSVGINQIGHSVEWTPNSSATGSATGVASYLGAATGTFTIAHARLFYANTAAKGAGQTITNLHGLYIADQTQGTNNYGITSLVSSGTNKWNIYASGTAANYFAGKVGIGTSSPTTALDVRGAQFDSANSGNIRSIDNSTLGANKGGGILFGGNYTGTVTTNWAAISGLKENATDGEYGGFLIFKTRANGNNLLERLRIDSAGSLLLRQSSNAANTSVSFNTTVQNALTLDSSGRLGIRKPTSIAYALDMDTSSLGGNSFRTTRGTSVFNITQINNGVVYVGMVSNNDLLFTTNDTERLRIDSSGSLLLRQSSNAANTSVSFNTTVQNALTLDSSGNLDVIGKLTSTTQTIESVGNGAFGINPNTITRITKWIAVSGTTSTCAVTFNSWSSWTNAVLRVRCACVAAGSSASGAAESIYYLRHYILATTTNVTTTNVTTSANLVLSIAYGNGSATVTATVTAGVNLLWDVELTNSNINPTITFA